MSFFSCMNLTFASESEDSSIAWLKPFSPPYDTSTILMILPCNLCFTENKVKLLLLVQYIINSYELHNQPQSKPQNILSK